MIKQIIQYLIPSLCFTLALTSCDKITKPYSIDEDPLVAYCDVPVFPVLEKDKVIQKFLFEEFTGHKCTNCPRGHQIAAKMKNEMSDTLILVSIHAGSLAEPEKGEGDCAFNHDFRTEIGNAIYKDFNISSNPSAMINRIKFNGDSYRLSDPDWESTMRSLPRQTPKIGMQIMAEYNSVREMVCIFVKTTLLGTIPEGARIAVIMVENEYLAPQKFTPPKPTECAYSHKHILRACATPTWQGKKLGISQADEKAVSVFMIDLKGKNLDLNDCVFIAYIMDSNSNEILQVEEAALSN